MDGKEMKKQNKKKPFVHNVIVRCNRGQSISNTIEQSYSIFTSSVTRVCISHTFTLPTIAH